MEIVEKKDLVLPVAAKLRSLRSMLWKTPYSSCKQSLTMSKGRRQCCVTKAMTPRTAQESGSETYRFFGEISANNRRSLLGWQKDLLIYNSRFEKRLSQSRRTWSLWRGSYGIQYRRRGYHWTGSWLNSHMSRNVCVLFFSVSGWVSQWTCYN